LSHELKQYDDAIGFLKRATQLDPIWSNAHHHLGSALYSSNRLGEAITAYENSLKLTPNSPETKAVTIHNLGLAFYTLGDRRAALEQKKLLDSLSPSWAEKLASILTPNVSGYWSNSRRTFKYKIIHDGSKITIQYLYNGEFTPLFEGVLEDNFAFGPSQSPYARMDRKGVNAIRIINPGTIEWLYYDKMNPKDSREKMREKLKEKSPSYKDILSKIQ
jgi:tetratricopeptide (TPR) repeat protein